jgi:hypothetical protein
MWKNKRESIARQRLGKRVPAGDNANNNRTSIATQRISKHASLTIEAVFSAWSVQSSYREVFSSVKWSEESSFRTPACQKQRNLIEPNTEAGSRSIELVVGRSWEDEFIWLSCRELGRVLEMAVEGDWEEMARKELDCDKKTSRVIWSYNETVINPLPGYD